MKGPANPLQNRILFHISHRRADENKLMMHHQKLTDTQEDQLCLASIHYLRSHFQEVRRAVGLPFLIPLELSVTKPHPRPPTFTSVCCWKTAMIWR